MVHRVPWPTKPPPKAVAEVHHFPQFSSPLRPLCPSLLCLGPRVPCLRKSRRFHGAPPRRLPQYQYRIREASCYAMMDLLGGRTWARLGDAVTEALPMIFRVMVCGIDPLVLCLRRGGRGC